MRTQRQVPEAEAEGKVKEIYEDIKPTLRVPAVSSLFCVLALQPDYLQMGWRVLKPNARTIYFEERSDELRRRAVDTAFEVKNRPLPADPDAIRPVLAVSHYALPKLYLAASSLRVASTGQQPRLLKLPESLKRQIVPGVPTEAAAALGEQEGTREGSQVLDDILATLHLPALGAAMQALGKWPDFLGGGWEVWKSFMAGPEHRRYRQVLYRSCEDAINSLPFRMEIYPHALRHAGLSETELDAVREALDAYHRALPDLMGLVSVLALATSGRDWAARNPFPPQLA